MGAAGFFLGAILSVELLVVALTLPQSGPPASYQAAVYPSVLEVYANSARAEEGLPGLVENDLLNLAAKTKAEDMAFREYFAHTSPDGAEPWDFIRTAGYQYRAAGENLAVNFDDSYALHTAWMNSPGHRENIVRPEFTEIGIGTARGRYKDKPAFFVAVMFGAPADGVVQAPVTPVLTTSSLYPDALALAVMAEGGGTSIWQTLLSSPFATANAFLFLIIAGAIGIYGSMALRQKAYAPSLLRAGVITGAAGTAMAANQIAAVWGSSIM